MKQLELSTEHLFRIGFIEKFCPAVNEPGRSSPAKTVYGIECLNGVFYCDPNEEVYRWYQQITIGSVSNRINLDITDKLQLDIVLKAFKIKQKSDEVKGHDSDCSVHNMPAEPNGPCDCGLFKSFQLNFNGNEIIYEHDIHNGVAGIAPNQPDELAMEIVRRWNKCHANNHAEYTFVSEVHRMACESLDPENFENLVKALNRMMKTRGIEQGVF